MKRIAWTVIALAFALGCTRAHPAHGRAGASGLAPGMFKIIPVSLDPSVSGYPGAVGDRVQSADGLHAWDRSGPNVTDWTAEPGSGGSIPDGGYTVTVADGGGLSGNGTAGSPLGLTSTWCLTEQAWLATQATWVTEWRCPPLGVNTVGPSGANGAAAGDGNLEGGSVMAVGNFLPLSTTVWQAGKTSGFVVELRGAFAAVSSNIQMFGLVNNAGNVWVTVALSSILTSPTNLVLRFSSSTQLAMTAPDTSVHNYAIIAPPGGASVKVYQDHVLIGNQTSTGSFSDVAYAVTIYNQSTTGFRATRGIWGYVAP